MAVSLGFASDAIVQEFYVDDDVDQKVRESIEQETGHPLVDVDYGGCRRWRDRVVARG